MCDEGERSNVPNVCQKLLSISLPHEQVCSQTIENEVSQYVTNIFISEQFVSKLWTILLLTQFLLLWIDDHLCMALRLCIIVESLYLQVRNIFPHISSRDLPCHRTKKTWFLHQVSLKLWSVVFPWHQQKSWIRTYFCNYPQHPCLSDILFECNPNKHVRGMMLVLPNQRLSWEFSMWD